MGSHPGPVKPLVIKRPRRTRGKGRVINKKGK